MKRPEGFDKPAAQPGQPSPKQRRTRGAQADRGSARRSSSGAPSKSTGSAPKKPSSSSPAAPAKGAPAGAPRAERGIEADHSAPESRARPSVAGSEVPASVGKKRASRGLRRRRDEPGSDVLARRTLRRAARERRRAEKAELRRFTRRARARKYAFLSVAGLLAVLLGLIAVAVFSPILSLRHVVVDGTDRIDPAEIQGAIESQSGTPLALLDFDAITQELSVFPLIRSYVTEIVPPDTLLVHIVEREPIGSVKIDGVYTLVDPAGITIQESAERIPGVPLIDVGGADASSQAFAAVTEVLLSLPTDLRSRVESISATTKDDVSFVLSGVGQGVVWGSASDSARKAALLETLISITAADRAGEFDVSAPSNGIFRPA